MPARGKTVIATKNPNPRAKRAGTTSFSLFMVARRLRSDSDSPTAVAPDPTLFYPSAYLITNQPLGDFLHCLGGR